MTTILIGTDLSEQAHHAATFAARLAAPLGDGNNSTHLLAVRVVGLEELNTRQIISQREANPELDAARQEVEEWMATIDTRGLTVEVEVHVGSPAPKLAEIARETNADFLVVGQSGKGRLARTFLGTTAEHLALDPPCQLAIVDSDGYDWDKPMKTISALDLGPSASNAMVTGARLAAHQGGELTLLHILELPRMSTGIADTAALPQTLATHIEDNSEWAQNEIDTIISERLPDTEGFDLDVEIRPGYPSHEILFMIEDQQATLLTMGTQKRSRLSRFFMGSVGRGVIKHTPCTTIVAPPVTDDE